MGQYVPSTARPVHRGDATTTTRLAGTGRLVPGMGAMVEEPTPKHCGVLKSDGHQCAGYASGDDGLCAGHRRQQRSSKA